MAHVVLHRGLAGERAAQALVGVAVVVLVGVLGLQLWGPRTALAAAALAALSPVLVLFDATLISEPLFTALMLTARCALAARARRGRAPAEALPWAVAAGAAAGLAALTRPEGLALAVAVAACAGSRGARWSSWWPPWPAWRPGRSATPTCCTRSSR